MLENRQRRVVLFLSVVGLAVAVTTLSLVLAQEKVGDFYYDYSGMSTGVIEVSVVGAVTMENTEYTVFRDGRVEVRIVAASGDHRVLDEFDFQLSEEAVRGMVEDAVLSGLARFDAVEFVRQLRERGQRIPHTEDTPAVVFKLNLEYLARGSDEAQAPFSHSFLLDDPDDFERVYRSQSEFAALNRIRAVLEGGYWEHRRSR